MTANPGAAFADIVEAASAVILPLWRSGLTVDTKSDDSPVTEADRRGEALILERLRAEFPDIPVIAEEDSAAGGVPHTLSRAPAPAPGRALLRASRAKLLPTASQQRARAKHSKCNGKKMTEIRRARARAHTHTLAGFRARLLKGGVSPPRS